MDPNGMFEVDIDFEGEAVSIVSETDSDSSSNSDDNEIQAIHLQLCMLIVKAMIAFLATIESFQPHELSRENQSTVNHNEPVCDQLGRTLANPPHFKDLTNFQVDEFHEFCNLVAPIIIAHARSTGSRHLVSGHPCKLTPEQWILSFIMYLKHDNIIYLDASMWNWSWFALCDDAIFVASCINSTLQNEIRWPCAGERRELGQRIPQLPGCIGLVDGTLVKLRRPFENQHHRKWFQGRKKMYCMNSSVVIDHDGLFVYVDGGYPGSYHDVTILRHSWVERNWKDLFVNVPGYCEYLLGDFGYTRMEKYVMRGFSKAEQRTLVLPPGPVKLFNQMHARYRVRVEWGIGGLKQKWRCLMKRFDLHRQKFATTFEAAAIMTNFLHRRRMDMRAVIEGQRERDVGNRGWAGDY